MVVSLDGSRLCPPLPPVCNRHAAQALRHAQPRSRLMIGWRPSDPRGVSASARLRCLNLVRHLQRQGDPVEVFTSRHMARYRLLVLGKPYDAVTCRLAERAKRRSIRLVIDLCDNYFYRVHEGRAVAKAECSLRRLIECADQVVVSTEALRDVVCEQTTAVPPMTVIGDMVESEEELAAWSCRGRASRHPAVPPLRSTAREHSLRLVWFGIHRNNRAPGGMADLLSIRKLLESLAAEYRLSLTVISDSWRCFSATVKPFRLPTHYAPWHPMTFHSLLRQHAIAVLPISPNPFTWCKSANRLATALSAGVAVVADAIPSYRPFRDVCILDRWDEGLRSYLSSADRRRADTGRAQTLIDASYRTPQIGEAWRRLLFTVLNHRPHADA